VQLHHAEALLRQHRFAEALEAFTATSAPPHTADQARWALGAGQALAGLRRFEEAGAHLEAAARRAATSGDAELMAAAANAMGFLAFRQRRFAQAHEIFHEALQRLAAAGLQQTEGYGKLLANLGRVCAERALRAAPCVRRRMPRRWQRGLVTRPSWLGPGRRWPTRWPSQAGATRRPSVTRRRWPASRPWA